MRAGNQASVESAVQAVRSGSSAALVVRGGATADWPGFRVTRASGAASEAALRGAGVHELCVQLLDQVERLSPSQRDVLRCAFDPSAEDQDASAVGLTLFTLLSLAAESSPVACLVRHPELLDAFSREVLAFTARRLVAESVALLFVVEDDVPHELAALQQLPATLPRRDDTVTAG
jgi:hypothetical protein